MKKVISFEKELDFPTMIGEITSISLDQNIDFLDSSSAAGEMVVSGGYKLTEASTLIEDFKYNIPVEITLTEKLDLSTTKISISDFNYEIMNDDILKCNIDLLLEGVEEVEIEEKEELEESEVDEEIEEKKERKIEIEEKKEEKEIEQIEILDDDSNRECDGELEEKKKEQEIPVKIEEEQLPFQIAPKEENEIEMPQAEISIPKKEEEKMKNQEAPLTSNISSLFQVFENSEETFTTYSVYIMRKEDTLDRIMDHYHVNREQLSEYNDLDNLEIGSKIIIPSYHE